VCNDENFACPGQHRLQRRFRTIGASLQAHGLRNATARNSLKQVGDRITRRLLHPARMVERWQAKPVHEINRKRQQRFRLVGIRNQVDDELDILTTLLEAYEREHFPIDLPDPIEAIKFRLEQTGKDSRALIGVIGQRTRVYEVMRRKRPLSLNMIRNLHEKLNVPAEVLIQPTRRYRRHVVDGDGNKLRRGRLRRSA